jgi:hypothetical protein
MINNQIIFLRNMRHLSHTSKDIYIYIYNFVISNRTSKEIYSLVKNRKNKYGWIDDNY